MSSSDEAVLSKFREVEVVEDLRAILDVITRTMAIPLYLMFWISDLIYMPSYKWPCLGLRLLVIPLCLAARSQLRKETVTAFRAQLICSSLAGLVALPITIMIAFLSDVSTGYYAGLNLVAIGGLSFLPLSMSFFVYGAFLIYFPYYVLVFSRVQGFQELSAILLNSFFIVGSIIVCFVIRNYHESLRLRELNLRLALSLEIKERNQRDLSPTSKEFYH